MSRFLISTFIATIMPAAAAAATGQDEAFTIHVVIDLLLLIAGLLCFTVCLKIFSLLKGGELSVGWQMLTASFLMLALGEVLRLSIALELIALHPNVAGIVQVLALFLLFLGVSRIKKG
ncbi:MAG: hypothetical protein KAT58_12200, partial [candidate division Zixibacteria bacterium]|nr:hypothetical protein [candidate division Zixibacteria bacterium]